MSSGANLAAPAATLSGAYAYEMAVHCRRWGVAIEDLLEGTGLTLDALKDPRRASRSTRARALVERARALTREPTLAFTMGLSMRLSWHGFLGFAAMAAGTVREALELAERFSLTRTEAFSLMLHVEGPVASLVLEEREEAPMPAGLREFAVITLLVGMGRIAEDATGTRLPGVAECAFPAPDYALAVVERAQAAGAGTMRFGQPAHRLVFDAGLLDLPLVSADPAAMQLARAQCDRELATLSEARSLVGRVRAEASRGGGAPGIVAVARRLGLSTRTLKRRLAEAGTTFRDVADGSRRQRALLLLDDRRIALADVADRLGYSDVANFTRAFRRWTGMTPGEFRGRARVGQGRA